MVSLFERSVFHSDSLKQKVTVGKDTLNIKRAVCCSEVGDIEKTVHRDITLMKLSLSKLLSQVTPHPLV